MIRLDLTDEEFQRLIRRLHQVDSLLVSDLIKRSRGESLDEYKARCLAELKAKEAKEAACAQGR